MDQLQDRYYALDGLRGFAAIGAAAYDLSAVLGLRHGDAGYFSHGYLAVDFLFCLSGFVLARAGTEHFAGMDAPIRSFLRARASRLLPLAAVVTFVTFLVRFVLASAGAPSGDDTPLRLLIDLPLGILMIPEYFRNHVGPEVFPLNACAWFLCVAALVSFVWGTLFLRASASTLLLGALLCLAALEPTALATNSLNFAGVRTVAPWLPLARGFLSFFLGAALWRASSGRIDAVFNFEINATLLCAVLWIPLEPSWPFDLACIGLFFPIMILFTAEADMFVMTRPVLSWLGKIALPIFLLHRPLLVVGERLSNAPLASGGWVMMPFILALWIALAWIVHAQIEAPLANWFARVLRC